MMSYKQIISLGGVGGCELAFALRSLGFPAYPYDWLITAQSFVLRSFSNKAEFFSFDDSCVHFGNHLIAPRKNAIMAHDFVDFDKQVRDVIDKYQRRYDRLETVLEKKEQILFVRTMENLEQPLQRIPVGLYDNLFIREEEDLDKWDSFIDNIIRIYSCECKLLLITDNPKHTLNSEHKHLILKHVQNKDRTTIGETIGDTLRVPIRGTLRVPPNPPPL